MKRYIICLFILLFIFVSCNTVDYRYNLTVSYYIVSDTPSPKGIETAGGIESFLNSRGFQTMYDSFNSTIETNWQDISTTDDTFMTIIRNINTFTETTFSSASKSTNNVAYTTTYIKYYISIYENHYTIRAVKRIVDNKIPVYNRAENNIVDVFPKSELWNQMELLAQEINAYLNITRYNFQTKRGANLF